MKKEDRRKLANRKRRIARRLSPRQWSNRPCPMFAARNIQYEMANRTRALSNGGIGAIHRMVRSLKLPAAIDASLALLKRHLPYHESDHVLNIAYNVVCGHECLEDLERLRQDEVYADLLGAQRIPDPTTAGDFLRRFNAYDVLALQDCFNAIRRTLWLKHLPAEQRRRACIDIDGTDVPTLGEKKAGMALSYKGVWGYAPLLVSLANTREPLFLVNRPGNAVSHLGAKEWIDRAIALCEDAFDRICLRGDTDFSLTAHFDEWHGRGVQFVFGFNALPKLVALATDLPEARYRPLSRPARYPVSTQERSRRDNEKERIVREKGYKNIRLCAEHVAEFLYRPQQCERDYRMIVLKKNLSIEKGERHLFDDVRYFFYITNELSCSMEEVVFEANARCNQENLFEQLKFGVHALRAPSHDLVSNGAYMVIAALAWSLKAWFALTRSTMEDRVALLRLEFKSFLQSLIRVPCQVVKGARRILLRVLSYTSSVRLLFEGVGYG